MTSISPLHRSTLTDSTFATETESNTMSTKGMKDLVPAPKCTNLGSALVYTSPANEEDMADEVGGMSLRDHEKTPTQSKITKGMFGLFPCLQFLTYCNIFRHSSRPHTQDLLFVGCLVLSLTTLALLVALSLSRPPLLTLGFAHFILFFSC